MSQFEAVDKVFQILNTLSGTPEGLTTPELSEQLQITRQTVLKYIQHLEGAGFPVYQDNRRRWFLDNQFEVPKYFSPAEFELMALLLERTQQISTSQKALISVLKPLANRFGVTIDDVEGAQTTIFELLVQARDQRRIVEILYKGLRATHPTIWLIKPFQFILPVWSDAVYALCLGRNKYVDKDQYLTLKINRIAYATLRPDRFEIPDTLRLNQRRLNAWNVWQSDDSLTHIVLHFAPHLYERLQESQWHISQRLKTLADGTIEMSLDISEPREIIPWIRSWGIGVRIVEPGHLKNLLIDELQQSLNLYLSDFSAPSTQPVFWAKYRPSDKTFHLLEAHLFDVAAVVYAFWDLLPASQQEWLCEAFELPADQTRIWLSFLAGAHDIGKASPDFQAKAPAFRENLSANGFNFPVLEFEPHGTVSAYTLRKYFIERCHMPKALASLLAYGIGGHHGEWISNSEIQNRQLGAEWVNAQFEILDMLWRVLGINQAPQVTDGLRPLIATWISGLTSVADWIGSQELYFPYIPTISDPQEYFQASCVKAWDTLAMMGFNRLEHDPVTREFTDLFPFTPNPMQKAILDSLAADRIPEVIIIEAPTGDGKTEIALYLADWLINQLHLSGMYIAMPTQATSNQMFQRTRDFLALRYPDQTINYQLIHGQAENHPLYQELMSNARAEGNDQSLIASEWFMPRKRSLLAPFAIGTVDQAMLSVLAVKHFFVRLFALCHKVMIVDEVHAYDTYMSTIQDRLLEWMKGMLSPLILLSATLPSSIRHRLIGKQTETTPYPRATVLFRDGATQVIPLSTSRQSATHINWIGNDFSDLSATLQEMLSEGGCAAVVCNTVAEAQHIYLDLRSSNLFSEDELMLFHAQFPPVWREGIESQVVQQFGKEGQRPERMILVATQIIEQSLDIDFDVMVTSVAPVDLLIQRIGRLHRHTRTRPPKLQQPTVCIRHPTLTGNSPSFGNDEFVYEPYILLLTWWRLRTLSQIRVPDDIEDLIEYVYSEIPADDAEWPGDFRSLIKSCYRKMKDSFAKQIALAQQNTTPPPYGDFTLPSGYHDDPPDGADDPRTGPVTTRLIQPGIRLVCLHQVDGELSFMPDKWVPCSLDRRPDREMIRQFMRHSVVTRNRHVLKSFNNTDAGVVLQWQQVPQLRDARSIVFEKGKFMVPDTNIVLKLDHEFGLFIEGGNS